MLCVQKCTSHSDNADTARTTQLLHFYLVTDGMETLPCSFHCMDMRKCLNVHRNIHLQLFLAYLEKEIVWCIPCFVLIVPE